jgi:hypothetical protein
MAKKLKSQKPKRRAAAKKPARKPVKPAAKKANGNGLPKPSSKPYGQAGRALDGPDAIAISSDGTSVYVGAFAFRHIDMPCTPARVWDAMQGKAVPPQ